MKRQKKQTPSSPRQKHHVVPVKKEWRFQESMAPAIKWIGEHERAIILVLLVIFAGMRMISLEADPPARSLGEYGAYYTDEGYRIFPARGMNLFNRPLKELSEAYHFHTAYTMAIPQIIVFKFFGVGFIQARIVSVLYGTLCLLLVTLLVKSLLGAFPAIGALWLLGMNSHFYFYSRLSLLEVPLSFYLILLLFLFVKAEKYPNLHWLAGIVAALALHTKPHALPAIGGYLAGMGLRAVKGEKKWLKKSIIFLAAFAAAHLVALLILHLTGTERIFYSNAIAESRSRLIGFTRLLVAGVSGFPIPAFYSKLPFAFYSAFLFIFAVLVKCFRNPREAMPVEGFAAVWILGQASMIALFAYQPLRFHITAIPIFCVTASFLIGWRVEGNLRIKPVLLYLLVAFIAALIILQLFDDLNRRAFKNPWKSNNFLVYGFRSLCLTGTLVSVAVLFFSKDFLKGRHNHLLILYASFLFILVFVVFRDVPHILSTLFKARPGFRFLNYHTTQAALISFLSLPLALCVFFKVGRGEGRLPNLGAILLVGLIAGSCFNGWAIIGYLKNLKFSLPSASKEIGKMAGKKGVLISRAATTLCLENELFDVSDVAYLEKVLRDEKLMNMPIWFAVTEPQELVKLGLILEKRLLRCNVLGIEYKQKFDVLENYDKTSFCHLYRLLRQNGPLRCDTASMLALNPFGREPWRVLMPHEISGHYAMLAEKDSNNVQLKLRIAEALIQESKPKKAIEWVNEALALEPNNADARCYAAMALMGLGNLSVAESQCKLSLSRNSNHVDALAALGAIQFKQNRLAEANANLNKALTLDSLHFYSNHWAGRVQTGMGNIKQALFLLGRGVRIRPDNAMGRNEYGKLLAEQKRLKDALFHFEMAVFVSRGFGEAWTNAGGVQRALGQIDRAIYSLNQAVRARPKDHLAYFNLGLINEERKRNKQAERFFQKTVKIDSLFAPGYLALSALYARSGNITKARLPLNRLIDLDPRNKNAFSRLEALLKKVREDHKNYPQLRDSPAFIDNMAFLFNDLGIAYLKADQQDSAMAYLKRALDIKPGWERPFMNMSGVYFNEKRYAKAAEFLQKALEVQPQNGFAHLKLGACLREMGRYQSSRQHLQRAQALRPGAPEVRRELEILDSALAGKETKSKG